MYSYTNFFLEGAGEAETNKGTRQGARSSCYLFIIFINELIKHMKNTFHPKPVIGNIHSLLHADDALTMATTFDLLCSKLKESEK